MLPEVGSCCETRLNLIEEKVQDFAKFSGDFNPIHVSLDEAKDYGFGKTVVHGAILLSEISRIIGTELPGHGALWSDLNITFQGPVFCGDIVDIKVEVVQSSPVINMVKLAFNITAGKRKVLAGTCRVMVLNKLNRRLLMPDMENRIALVTGGSRGLGLECVREYLDNGYSVISVSRQASKDLKCLKEQYGEKLEISCIDLMDLEAISIKLNEVIGKMGGINIVVHAAGPVPAKKSFSRNIREESSEYFKIYTDSLVEILDVCLPYMKSIRYGRIIAIGSSFILGTPPPGMYTYIMGKEALWGLIKSLSVDYARYGITANMVSPSMMITDMTSEIPNPVKYNEAESSPLKRLVEPEEVAKTVIFLCGDGSASINGVNLPVTGGKQ